MPRNVFRPHEALTLDELLSLLHEAVGICQTAEHDYAETWTELNRVTQKASAIERRLKEARVATSEVRYELALRRSMGQIREYPKPDP